MPRADRTFPRGTTTSSECSKALGLGASRWGCAARAWTSGGSPTRSWPKKSCEHPGGAGQRDRLGRKGARVLIEGSDRVGAESRAHARWMGHCGVLLPGIPSRAGLPMSGAHSQREDVPRCGLRGHQGREAGNDPLTTSSSSIGRQPRSSQGFTLAGSDRRSFLRPPPSQGLNRRPGRPRAPA